MAARKFTSEEKAKALVALEANNGNISRTARMLGVPRSTLKAWAHGKAIGSVTPDMVAKEASDLASKFERIADILTDALSDPEKIKKASLSQVAIAAGIATDKSRVLRSLPSSITQRVETDESHYRKMVSHLLQQAKAGGFPISESEAIELLEVHHPKIREYIN